jgi:predicted GNAT family acetyltransferase
MDGTDSRPIAVRHVPTATCGAFVIERDEQRLAEMTYVRAGEKRIIVDHTFVDDALRGEGAGRKLLQALVEWARAEQLLVIPVCPFAKSMFERDASIRDVLA